ncbi:hypothetical protein [Clostridium psychrophilum]|uniref:hypothetical protein n=1 Tax=Clostridium psychrophilum TaxID=132926 RepID=UPI001C0DCC34|nr:hypothetical protein [Clostridium psychrophilum]MBU3183209.1 hypothetical protein [Clostridium psychrophilum]
MTTEAKIQITSSELGILWSTYISKSARLLIHNFFKSKTMIKPQKAIFSPVGVKLFQILGYAS